MTNRPKDDREFARFSVDLPDNPKIHELADPAAAWGYATAILYCARNHTDGYFNLAAIAQQAGISKLRISKIVRVGLVHLSGHTCKKCPPVPAGKALIHDYLEHNRSSAEVEQTRRSHRTRGQAGAAKRWGNSHSQPIATAMATAIANPKQEPWLTDSKPMAEVEEEISTHLDTKAATTSTRASEEPPEHDRPPTRPRITGPRAADAKHLVASVIPPEFGSTIRTALAIEAAGLLREIDPDTIREALHLWTTRTGIGPKILPSLVADVVKGRTTSTGQQHVPRAGARSGMGGKARDWADLGATVQAELDAQNGFRLIEGGRS